MELVLWMGPRLSVLQIRSVELLLTRLHMVHIAGAMKGGGARRVLDSLFKERAHFRNLKMVLDSDDEIFSQDRNQVQKFHFQ